MRQIDTCFDLYIYSKYRTELMGIATILIILVHANVYGVGGGMSSIVRLVLGNAGCGVDIFLFLSGMGMYNSYGKHILSNQSLLTWLMRHYLRIIIPLFLIVLPLIIWNPYECRYDFFSVMIELSGFGNLFGYGQLWFLPCILLLYMFTPLMNLINNFSHKRLNMILCCGVIMSACYIFHSDSIWLFILQRWPSYIIGYMLAQDINEHKKGSVNSFILLPIIAYCVCYYLNHRQGAHFSLFWLQGIPVMTIVGIGIEHVSDSRLHKCLTFLGVISLESYITNDYVIRALQTLNWTFLKSVINYDNYLLYYGGTAFCFILSYFVNIVSKHILRSLNV